MPMWMLLLAAPALSPGLWETRNEPGQATLGDRSLDDLPLGEISTDRICLMSRQAAEPGAWLARDVAADCKLGRATLRGGKVTIRGVCAATEERGPGEVLLTGRYAPASYDIRFQTAIKTEQGTMTFSGHMTGRRTGDCPAETREGGK